MANWLYWVGYVGLTMQMWGFDVAGWVTLSAMFLLLALGSVFIGSQCLMPSEIWAKFKVKFAYSVSIIVVAYSTLLLADGLR